MIDINAIQSVFFIGIGGVSNSAIAEILHDRGVKVSGSDMSVSDLSQHLISKGITVYKGHDASHVKDAELVVYTAAVNDKNPELKYALENGIPCLSRAEMLGQLMTHYNQSIAISGTHGKTTTTSMVTRLINDTRIDPTCMIGGYFNDIKSNVKIGESDVFLTEACEYKESFLSFYPQIGVILNIEEDHLDYYENLERIIEAFIKFTQNIKEDGLLVINGDDYNAKKVLPYYHGKYITFGMNPSCDYTARNIVYNGLGFPTFDIYKGDLLLTRLTLSVLGQHNIYNALAAFIIGHQFIDNTDVLKDRLSSFHNAKRRFEFIGESAGVKVYDDYAHHPSEIKAMLEAASRIENKKRLICLFQPHTYSRTKELLHEFSGAFKLADEVKVVDIYAAREDDPGDIHSKDLVRELLLEGADSEYYESFESMTDALKSELSAGDLVVTVGAGSIYQAGQMLLDKL